MSKYNSNRKTYFVNRIRSRRDYKTLILAQNKYEVKILTKIDLRKFSRFKHFSIIKGSFHDKGITNLELKNMYISANIVVVPIKNVL